MSLSVGLITYNEERRLGRTLESIKNIADEIIIVDSNSTDNTVEIAKKYGAKVYVENWKGYGLQKNSVIEKCTKDWILLIDADEVISDDLSKKILEVIKEGKEELYDINFTSVCFGKQIKHGGWSGSYRIRLFKNGIGKYNDNVVHESFETNGKKGKLTEEIYHYSYEDLSDYLSKFNRYTSEGAKEYHKRGKKANFFGIVINPIFKFIRMYFFRLGFLDGVEGLLLAILSSNYTMVKYYKLLELNRRDKNGNK
ncbi:MAG: glycosyltransferase family 2 protein [Fusobacteriaceae bacterium]|nr:glycosyltransferase family 2 protein [Fusobacteriaceae bacterium]MBN2838142.1 glycosyltransferase family 2 protein [Fusobacteriaceae bacterium]